MDAIIIVQGKIALFSLGKIFRRTIQKERLMVAPSLNEKAEILELAKNFATQRSFSRVIVAIDENDAEEPINQKIRVELGKFLNVKILWAKPDFISEVFPAIKRRFHNNPNGMKKYVSIHLEELLEKYSTGSSINANSYLKEFNSLIVA